MNLKQFWVGLIGAAILFSPGMTWAQTAPTFDSGAIITGKRIASDERPLACILVQPKAGDYAQTDSDAPAGVAQACVQAVRLVDSTGAAVSAAGGGGDASAANQTTQITAAQLTNTTLGAVTASPTANTIGDRLKTLAANTTGLATSAAQTTAQTSLTALVAAVGATGSAVPASADYAGAVSSGNLVGVIQADASAAINVATATTTQIVALSSGKKIYVTSFDVVAGGTGNITLEYGTGSSCGTGTTVLTGAYNLVAQAGVAKGSGLGPILVVPASNALCVLTSAAVQMSGSVSYTQF